MSLTTLLTGGFLKGQRTYVLGLLLAIQAIVAWLVGDSSLTELFAKVPEILGGLGIMALRAGMSDK